MGDKREHNKTTRMADIPYYKYHVLLLLLLTHLLNQLGRYVLSITIKPISQELQFGEQDCQINSSQSGLDQVPQKYCEIRNYSGCIHAPSIRNVSNVCTWDYDGQGLTYQILVGPVFTVVFTITGVLFGFIGDNINRKMFLCGSMVFWSMVTIATGFVHSYWQLAVLRFCLGIGEAGCTPFATSLIADYFSKSQRGLALGIYNLGIYMGYSLSFALGNFVTTANILGQGWRWSFFVAGIPGILVGLVMFLTVKEPHKPHAIDKINSNDSNPNQENTEKGNSSTLTPSSTSKGRTDSYHTFDSCTTNPNGQAIQQEYSFTVNDSTTLSNSHKDHSTSNANGVILTPTSEDDIHARLKNVSDKSRILESQSSNQSTTDLHNSMSLETFRTNLIKLMKAFLNPSLALLVTAGSVRNSAGFVWAYNTQQYFSAIGQSPTEIGAYMSWVPMVGGSIGVVLGGLLSDKVVKNRGSEARIMVVVLSQTLSVPFAVATLLASPPTAYILQIPAFIIGEMWVGVALTVVVELVPVGVRTAAIAVYLFVSNNIAGAVPLTVPVLRQAFQKDGFTKAEAFRDTLYVLYPGLISVGVVLFFITVFILKKDKSRNRIFSQTDIEVMPPETVS